MNDTPRTAGRRITDGHAERYAQLCREAYAVLATIALETGDGRLLPVLDTLNNPHDSDASLLPFPGERIPHMKPGADIVVGEISTRLAMEAALGAIATLQEQISQMSDTFDDEDGAIGRAVEDGEHASACIAATLKGEPLPPAPGSDGDGEEA